MDAIAPGERSVQIENQVLIMTRKHFNILTGSAPHEHEYYFGPVFFHIINIEFTWAQLI